MIQRIQTLLLAVAIVLNLAGLFVPVWQFDGAQETETLSAFSIDAAYTGVAGTTHKYLSATANVWQMAWWGFTLVASAVLGWAIFQYKNRPAQMKIVYAGTILSMIGMLSLILLAEKGPYLLGAAGKSEAAYGIIFPMMAILSAMFAARRIKADEELVRSADRLR